MTVTTIELGGYKRRDRRTPNIAERQVLTKYSARSILRVVIGGYNVVDE